MMMTTRKRLEVAARVALALALLAWWVAACLGLFGCGAAHHEARTHLMDHAASAAGKLAEHTVDVLARVLVAWLDGNVMPTFLP